MSQTQIQKLRKLLKSMSADDVVQVLLEQGWVTEQGVLANDLEDVLESAVALAYNEPLASDERTHTGETQNVRIGL